MVRVQSMRSPHLRAGHNGKFAAQFVAATIAFELVMLPEFRDGDYSTATIQRLIDCPQYTVEKGQWLVSGACASVALITTNITYFASLGNSPVVVRYREDVLFDL